MEFYTCSNKIIKCDIADVIDKLHLIIGHSGNGCLFIDNIFSSILTNHLLYCNDDILLYYIYFMLESIWDIFYINSYKGSTVKNTSDSIIYNFKIPIPKNKEKITEWVEKISNPYDKKNKNTQKG